MPHRTCTGRFPGPQSHVKSRRSGETSISGSGEGSFNPSLCGGCAPQKLVFVRRRHTVRARIAIAAGLVALALILQALWYRGMSRRVVARAEVLRQHFAREVSRDDSRSRQAARLHHRALGITKIVCNGWGPLFFIPCLLCVGAVGVLLFRSRKELRAHEGPAEDAQPTDGTGRGEVER